MFARDTNPTQVADGVVRLGTELVNWYLVEDGGRVTIVDCGAPAYYAQLDSGLALLDRNRGHVDAIVLTHGHGDHIGFAERARTELGVPVYVHESDEKLTTTGKPPDKNEKSLTSYLRYPHAYKLIAHLISAGGVPKPVQEVTTFGDGDELDVPGKPRVVLTPGHTAGHVVFLLESRGLLLMGDLLCTLNPLTGAHGPQLMPRAFNVSSATILDSLSKIEELDTPTLAFGHGDPWTQGVASAVRHAHEVGPT
ncbi:MAG TPA: MBL fold metallo-hydrolase [Gaiellaceae bacterium]|jgi:glyoxylase-like metal-dependent hydrolase (beta-lactamase superfamily II)